jgi:hypothetical protein
MPAISEGIVVMHKHSMRMGLSASVAGVIAAVLACPPAARGQNIMRQPGAVYDPDVKDEKPGPAPRRDISGTWEPAASANAAVNADGVRGELPFTAEGKAAYVLNKPTRGATAVAVAEANDPFQRCDPQGFPRILLHNFRTARVLQTPENVVMLYLYNRKWRVIWTDGRPLPKEVDEARWWGYSVGRWTDDFTFVVETTGIDSRSWLDNAGRPHSDAMRVEERYRRVDRDHLEMTVVIDDPTYYTKPWTALTLSLRLQSPSFDIRENECVPSEMELYNKLYGDAEAGKTP